MMKARNIIGLAALAVILILLAFSALPATIAVQAGCPKRGEMRAFLQMALGETLVGGGRLDEKRIAEFYLAPSGSWTLTGTGADGLSCILESGTDWQMGAPMLPGEKGA